MQTELPAANPIEPAWTPLVKLGAGGAFLVIALLPVQLAVFVTYPPPADPRRWFELLERHPIIGLVDLDILMLVDIVVVTLMFGALAMILRRASPVRSAVALSAQLIAVSAYLASSPALEMLALARRYGAAGYEERTSIVAAGHALLAGWQGTSFSASYVLSAVATLCVSTAMWRSPFFGRGVAALGIVYGTLNLVPSSAGWVGYVLSLLSLAPMTVWLAMIGRRLVQLSRPSSATGNEPTQPMRAHAASA